MKEFFKKNGGLILVGFIGVIVGAILQYFANIISNEKLKKELLAELNILIGKRTMVSDDEQKRITELRAQINLLNRK